MIDLIKFIFGSPDSDFLSGRKVIIFVCSAGLGFMLYRISTGGMEIKDFTAVMAVLSPFLTFYFTKTNGNAGNK